MDPLLLCSETRLSLCGAPTVSPCGEPQPIGVDAPSLLYGERQPIDADMPILIRSAQAPCAKGLLNPGDDAHHDVIHRVAGSASASMGPWRVLVFLVDEVDGRGGALVGWHAWKRWMCYRLRLSPSCVARRLCAISLGGGKQMRKWHETVACS